MQPTPLTAFYGAPFYGPFEINSLLAQGVAGPFEGVWVPVGVMKFSSVEVEGTFGALSVQLLGSNSIGDPLNLYTVTVGGSITAGDPLTLTFTNANLANSVESVVYTAQAGDTVNTIAAALAAAINADANLQKLGFTATFAAAVVTVSYPNVPPQYGTDGYSQTNAPPQNFTILTKAVGGSATETLAVANASVGGSVGAAITAAGLAAPSQLTRWIKAQVNTLTGGSAANPVTVAYHGAG